MVSGKDLKKHAWSCSGGPEQNKISRGDKNPPGDTVLNITDFVSALRAWQWRPLQGFENGPAYPDYFHRKGSEH